MIGRDLDERVEVAGILSGCAARCELELTRPYPSAPTTFEWRGTAWLDAPSDPAAEPARLDATAVPAAQLERLAVDGLDLEVLICRLEVGAEGSAFVEFDGVGEPPWSLFWAPWRRSTDG